MKKIISTLLIVFCGVLFIGCGASKLSSNYNEEDLKIASEKIITNLNDGKYEDVVDMGSDELKSQLSKEKIEEAYEALKGKLGKYESIEKISFKEKDDIAAVIAIAKYENGKAQFTLSFNTDIKLMGIYMK